MVFTCRLNEWRVIWRLLLLLTSSRFPYPYDPTFYCPVCKGVWLDREIDKIARAQNAYEEEHYQKYHKDGKYYDYDDYHERRRKRGFLGDLFDFD